MTEASGRKIPFTRTWGIVLALSTAVISGFAIFINGYAVKHVPDATVFTTAKNGVAAMLLLLFLAPALARGRTRSLPRTTRAWVTLVALGAIGGSVPFVLFFEGLSRAASPQAAFIHKTLVIWVALLAVPLLHERLSALHLVAIGALVAGQAVLLGGVGSSFGAPEAMILGATLLWAIEVVVAKTLLADVGSLVVGASRMGVGLVVLLLWTAVTGRFGGLVSLTASQWSWVALTGLVLAAYVGTWFAALARAQAVDVTAVLVLGAVISALLDSGVRHVPLTSHATGLALVTVGVGAIAVFASRRRIVEANP